MEQTKKSKAKLRRWGHGPNPLILKKSPTRRPEFTATPSRVDYAVEAAAFARARTELLAKYPGKFVVFVGADMLGPFDSFAGAVSAARRKFGYVAVYTKQLTEDDTVRLSSLIEAIDAPSPILAGPLGAVDYPAWGVARVG